ncbi:enoyl-CoA hydratase [Aureimonas sp. Leaf454]|uniref:MaoC family dehydratase n=1 Tax=Aureimonas sp. Leaf454 TaxID=1736381 RepID=UPI0006F3F268|nr:MaoC family dehydratase [Aureimonas sp. Leaf454]KQT45131.1 enoyl-CoA hydratase [Aureimonas sp. Leaf454]
MQTFEDFPVGATRPLGPYAVTREEVIAFAAEFDPQPFHLDDDAAAASMLGGLSASGWHTCSMMMRMMADGFILDSTSQGSPGVDFVKWKRPVRPGDTLSGTMTVLEARVSQKRPTIGIAKLRNDLVNQNGEPVLACEYTVMLSTRAGSDA